jgi:glycosyltransferase involved in cell wall biosynthesis
MAGVIVHEWIAQTGGSENVVEVMAGIYPEADVVCLWNDSVGRFNPSQVRESWLARTPLRRSKALSVPFMPATWRRMRDRDYDFALISSHLFAHHARFAGVPDSRRFVYVHSPARYIWSPELDRRGAGMAAKAMSAVLKPIDRQRAQETQNFAVNSDFVRQRLERSWGLPATTMYPPVQVAKIQAEADWSDHLDALDLTQLSALPTSFLLGASRFVPYKRLDQVIRAGEVTGMPVVLAGGGPLAAELRAQAKEATVPVHFIDSPSTALLYSLYQRCAAYIFPAVEDFGIMPVEAMAAGAPVVANRVGGAAESVVSGVTGALTDFESDEDLRQAVEIAIATQREDRLRRARDFSVETFSDNITSWVSAS